MTNAIPHIIDYLTRRTWALDEPVLRQMVDILDRHTRGIRLSADEIAAAIARPGAKAQDPADAGQADPNQLQILGTTAVIHVTGIIAKYSSMVNGTSQPRGTSIETLRAQLDQALGDDHVENILLRIDSPGGYAVGVADFADEVFEASAQKPVTAFADAHATSAAYFIGSQAAKFYATQDAFVGGIGVYAVIPDTSKAAEAAGIKVHLVRSGPNKGVHVPGVTVTEANLAAYQELVDGDFETFLAAILRGRADAGLDAESLRKLADGRMFTAVGAKTGALIDGVTTLDKLLNELETNPPAVRRSARAQSISPPAAASASSAAVPTAVGRNGEAFDDMVARHVAAGDSRGTAITKAVHENPAAHRAWLLANQATSRPAADVGNATAKTFDDLVATNVAAGDGRGTAIAKAADANPHAHAAWIRANQGTSRPAADVGGATAPRKAPAPRAATTSKPARPRAKTDEQLAGEFVAHVRQLQGEGHTMTSAMSRASRERPKGETAWRRAGCPWPPADVGGPTAKAFDELVAGHVAGGDGRGTAIGKAAAANPEAHAAWIAAHQH